MTALVFTALAVALVAGLLLLALRYHPRQETTMPKHLAGCDTRGVWICADGCPVAANVQAASAADIANAQTRPPRAALADMHAYVVPISPKTLRETLCVAQAALNELERQRPGYNAGGTIASHCDRLGVLIEEIDRMRPLGPGGKHDDRHTPVCGCRR